MGRVERQTKKDMKVRLQGRTFDIPNGYGTMSWKQYLDIEDALTDNESIARLMGIPYSLFMKQTDIEGVLNIKKVIGFLKEKPLENPKPFLITVLGEVILTPSSFEHVGLDQYEDIARVLGDETVSNSERITSVVAIASMKRHMEIYNSEHIGDMKKLVGACTVQSVLDTYLFFCRRSTGSTSGTLKTLKGWTTLARRLWRGFVNWKGSGY